MKKIFQIENYDKKPLILIVDDIAKNIQVVANILGKDDYDISVALNGRQALSIMEKVRPDLILLDVMMPDIDGYEVCRTLKKDRRTDSIPVIFLTAKSDKEDIVKGFEMGAVDYVLKPFNPVELLARVRTHVSLKITTDLLMEKIAQLAEMASKDSLTGLYNHGYLLEMLEKRIFESKRHKTHLSVFMFDIDRFKKVNDTFGHKYGDLVLKNISNAAKDSIRKSDIIGRYGGEEFIIIFPNINREEAFIVADKIRKKIEEIKWEKKDLKITVSGGVAQYHGGTAEDLVIKADELLYRAKANGRNRIEKDS